MSVGRRIVPTLVRYLYREAAANKSKQSTNVPPCHPLHLPSHRETSTLSVVASLATVIKDPVHQVGLFPVRWQAILICGDMVWVVRNRTISRAQSTLPYDIGYDIGYYIPRKIVRHLP